MKIRKKQNGFTLIELLLVIVVISIMAGVMLSVVNVNVLRGRARDSQRKSDLAKIQAALELYYADNRIYPGNDSTFITKNWVQIRGGVGPASDALTNLLAPASGVTYINTVPRDPLNTGTNSTPCTNATNYRYNFRTGASHSIYLLTAIMESNTSDDDSKCTSLSNWSKSVCWGGASYNATCGCSGATTTPAATDVCYGVQNP